MVDVGQLRKPSESACDTGSRVIEDVVMTISSTERLRKCCDTTTAKRRYRLKAPVCSDEGADFRFMIEKSVRGVGQQRKMRKVTGTTGSLWRG